MAYRSVNGTSSRGNCEGKHAFCGEREGKMKPRNTALALIAMTWLAAPAALAQEHATHHETMLSQRHKVSLSFGYAYVREGVEKDHAADADPEKGVYVPSLGIDYQYRLNEKWALGGVADLELSHYVVLKKDLERDKAFLLAALAFYELVPFWEVYAGGGVELEKHENLGIIRLGTEYEFRVGERGWAISPVLMYDIKEGYDTWSLAVAAGRWF
jgi:opacity protein-like surface antigen